ncbi:hypothetical protein ACTOB_006368 [Actinoplanes oblitus]|uniref:Uncharacterized protein n=1 Tax=Actinoplanes oblitus TaxID=3040509 RepID=A0ABY8WD71_9ACTN|nr:hypothetical protein [Actinoplanes oblitus]WIM94349.1 hypothetical protein ACTOB_006368 [Actinoplanes oblitus]
MAQGFASRDVAARGEVAVVGCGVAGGARGGAGDWGTADGD